MTSVPAPVADLLTAISEALEVPDHEAVRRMVLVQGVANSVAKGLASPESAAQYLREQIGG